MAAEVDKMRPNIRVQIHNNLLENMDVNTAMEIDDGKSEEGEISDDNNSDTSNLINAAKPTSLSNKIWISPPTSKSTFTTGINIFDKEEQDKLLERARRFALKPDEIKLFSDEDLQELHLSLGITDEIDPNVRFEAIHMLGCKGMSIEDILEYFQKYAPINLEWIDENSCNVLWSDNISAARAMHYISKAVKGMPARGPCSPFIDDEQEEQDGKSVLLRNKNREIELKDDDGKKISYKNGVVDISEITVPIPPGFWRLGSSHNSNCILLRFAFKTDKKPFRTESFSKIYKKLSNFETKRKGIFDRNKELNRDEKNPWGSLARNWNHDVKFCEREPVIPELPKLEIKNPSLLVRLGAKRKLTDDKKDHVDELASEMEDIVESEPAEKKKVKIPRMRMYADEEEEKLKRKKILQTIKKQTDKLSENDNLSRSDLRNVLGITNRAPKQTEIDSIDLGSKLKNRNQKMTFTLLQKEEDQVENVPRKKDVRSFLDERRSSKKSSPVALKSLRSDRMSESKPRKPKRPSYSEDDEEPSRIYSSGSGRKPKSKVAVVIKTQKKPTVASTIWSRVKRPNVGSGSSSESESESEGDSSSSSGEEQEENETVQANNDSKNVLKGFERPGFSSDIKTRLSGKMDHKSPLKIEINNDHFKN